MRIAEERTHSNSPLTINTSLLKRDMTLTVRLTYLTWGDINVPYFALVPIIWHF